MHAIARANQIRFLSLSVKGKCTCNLEMISPLVRFTRSASSIAKAGNEMTDRRPASISFEVEALGSMEHRIDCGNNVGDKTSKPYYAGSSHF